MLAHQRSTNSFEIFSGCFGNSINAYHIDMKHFVTAFLSLILLTSILGTSSAQVASRPNLTKRTQQATVAKPAGLLNVDAKGEFSKNGGSAITPEAALQYDTVGYFQDTTGGNWWTYAPTFDSIGPITIGLSSTTDTTALDTMYYRLMGLRVNTPTDFAPGKTRYIDGASITVAPIAMDPADHLEFWVVPIEDVQFNSGSVYPIPDLFSNTSTTHMPYATASIPADSFVVGQINTVSVSFGHKSLGLPGTKTQLGIIVFVDGPNFANDTIDYLFDANLGPWQGANLVIDTDGTSTGIIMRTYDGKLDAGHLLLGGSTQPSLVGGMSGFFADIQTAADPTQSFNGNLILNTYFSGTPGANSVSGPTENGYQLSSIYPNPVGTSAQIQYRVGSTGAVSLKVYNVMGQEVATLVNHVQSTGEHNASFDASTLSSGVYYYTLRAGAFTQTQRMVIAH
jgi:hypothetical protein